MRINQEIGSAGRTENLDIAARFIEDLESSNSSKGSGIKKGRGPGSTELPALGKGLKMLLFDASHRC
jgi:hypothetical protein